MLKGKRFKFIIPALLAGIFFVCYSLWTPLPTPKNQIQFYSTHKRDDLKLTLIHAIKKAKKSIYLKTYALTDVDILSLLRKKANDGVEIHLYYHQKTSPKLSQLEGEHFHFYPIQGKGLMHEKVWIIDEVQVFLGSANVTYSSLKMHDNCVLGLFSPILSQALIEGRPQKKTIEIEGQEITYYSLPNDEALTSLLSHLDEAQSEVILSLFTFTHPLIVEKLIQLHNQGVNIHLYVDGYTARGASKKACDRLKQAGVPTEVSKGPQLFHHKWALIDNTTLILGSANWTQAAFTKNWDYILFLKPINKKQIKKFIDKH